jgi:hypothetical protein
MFPTGRIVEFEPNPPQVAEVNSDTVIPCIRLHTGMVVWRVVRPLFFVGKRNIESLIVQAVRVFPGCNVASNFSLR